eukprot:6207195-Pleurochrysis_carterae.AAC.2
MHGSDSSPDLHSLDVTCYIHTCEFAVGAQRHVHTPEALHDVAARHRARPGVFRPARHPPVGTQVGLGSCSVWHAPRWGLLGVASVATPYRDLWSACRSPQDRGGLAPRSPVVPGAYPILSERGGHAMHGCKEGLGRQGFDQ